MCLWSRVPKPSSQKEVNSAGESCGSWLCGCGSAAGQCLLPTASRNTEPLPHRAGPRLQGAVLSISISPQRCQEPLQLSLGSYQLCLCHGTVGRALHSCLWCQHPEQTHSDHTCVTERPLAWIGPVFWLKSYDCPAAFESCDITVSNSYIYMYIDTTTS